MEGAWMTSQLCHCFQTSQAVHGADDITTPNFQIEVNSLSICGPQVDTLIYGSRPECPTYLNFPWSKWLLMAPVEITSTLGVLAVTQRYQAWLAVSSHEFESHNRCARKGKRYICTTFNCWPGFDPTLSRSCYLLFSRCTNHGPNLCVLLFRLALVS